MITNASQGTLYKALDIVNERYGGNIRIKELTYLSPKRIQFTLSVHNSRNSGARRSRIGRRIAAACYHVHGHFFDALFSIEPEAYVRVSRHGNQKITKQAGNWQDFNIGSIMRPFMASEACECI